MTENGYADDELINSTSSSPSNDAIIISSSSEEDNSGSSVINEKGCKVNFDFIYLDEHNQKKSTFSNRIAPKFIVTFILEMFGFRNWQYQERNPSWVSDV